MKTWVLRILSVAMLTMTGWIPASAAESKPQATFHEQLNEMGYLILHLSSINLINGLNLTRDQAVKLRAMAQEVERSGIRPPQVRGEFGPELKQTLETYLETRDKLLRGEEIPRSLEIRVAQARIAESTFIRDTLLSSPSEADAANAGTVGAAARASRFASKRGATRTGSAGATMSCEQCHAPVSSAGNGGVTPKLGKVETGAGAQKLETYQQPQLRLAMYTAHQTGVFGMKGMMLVNQKSSAVLNVLTDAQRAVVGDFTCCLVPPKSMNDPVRVGQASSNEKEANWLRLARSTPDSRWPMVKEQTTQMMVKSLPFYRPGTTEKEMEARKSQFADALEKARKMSDTEFEMEKDKLCGELKLKQTPKTSDKGRSYQAASFLLLPGSAQAYDRVIARMDKQPK